jgi:hypothetical protein
MKKISLNVLYNAGSRHRKPAESRPAAWFELCVFPTLRKAAGYVIDSRNAMRVSLSHAGRVGAPGDADDRLFSIRVDILQNQRRTGSLIVIRFPDADGSSVRKRLASIPAAGRGADGAHRR